MKGGKMFGRKCRGEGIYVCMYVCMYVCIGRDGSLYLPA